MFRSLFPLTAAVVTLGTAVVSQPCPTEMIFHCEGCQGASIPETGTSGDTTRVFFAVKDIPEHCEVVDVKAHFSLEHTWNSDLEIFIKSPDFYPPTFGQGVLRPLFTDICGGNDDMELTISAVASTRYSGSSSLGQCPPTSNMTLGPETPGIMNVFLGAPKNGEWEIDINDDASGDVGLLNFVSLTFVLQEIDLCAPKTFLCDGCANMFISGQNSVGPSTFGVPVNINPLCKVKNVAVNLDISHTRVGDLAVSLFSPTDGVQELFSGVCGSSANMNLTIDALSSTRYTGDAVQCPPISGQTLGPEEGSLANLLGGGASGQWAVNINDIQAGESGQINSVSLTFDLEYRCPYTITHCEGCQGALIPESGSRGGTTRIYFNLPEGDETCEVYNLATYLDLQHTWNGDLRVWLLNPSQVRRDLFTNVCGSNDNMRLTIAATDTAARYDGSSGQCPPTSNETYGPESADLDVFLGAPVGGEWEVDLDDVYSGDVGAVNFVSLTRYMRPVCPETVTVQCSGCHDARIPSSGSTGSTRALFPVQIDPRCIVTNIQASFALEHTSNNNLQVFLENPNGVRANMWTNVCAATNNMRMTIDANAATPYADGSATCPSTGYQIYGPETAGALDVFLGTPVSGEWDIDIVDSVGVDTGSIETATLTFTLSTWFTSSPTFAPPTVSPTFMPTSSPSLSPSAHFEHLTVEGHIDCGQVFNGTTSDNAHVGGHEVGGHGGNTREAEDEFHTFDLASGATIEFSTCGSSFDTFLRVLMPMGGDAGENTTEYEQVLACDDCNHNSCDGPAFRTIIYVTGDNRLTSPYYGTPDFEGSGSNEVISSFPGADGSGNNPERNLLGYGRSHVFLPPGQYVIQVEGWSNRDGNYSLSMLCTTDSPTATPTALPTALPTASPTASPSSSPSPSPTIDSRFDSVASQGNDDSADIGMIIGIAIGVILLLVLIGVIAFVLTKNAGDEPDQPVVTAFENPGFDGNERGIDNPMYESVDPEE